MQRGNPMELNFEYLEIQKRNILMDWAQRVDKKNGVICLAVIFTPTVTVIRKSQIAHFFVFLLMAAKKVVTVLAKHLIHLKDLI